MSIDYGFLGEKESEDRVSLVLVIRERRHKMTWAVLLPTKRNGFSLDREESSEVRCARETASGRKSVQQDHRARGGPRCLPGQGTEGRIGAPHGGQSPARRKDIVLVGGVCGILDEQVRHRQGRKDTAAKTARAKGQHTDPGVWRKDPVHARQTSGMRKVGAAVPPRSNSSSEAVVVTEQGLAIKTRSANIRRVPESERWDADSILQVRATPWSPDGSDNATDIQVGMERPAEMVPRDPGKVLTENKVARTYLRRADFEQWGLSEGCPGCRYLRTGQGRQQAHSEARRKRIEGLLKGDSMGTARLAAADERINRALADAGTQPRILE